MAGRHFRLARFRVVGRFLLKCDSPHEVVAFTVDQAFLPSEADL